MTKRIIFSDYDAMSKAKSEILKNSNLQETIEESYKKTASGRESNSKIIIRIAKDLFAKNTSEKDLSLLLEKKFEISKQVAKNILEEIKEKLIPLLKETQIEESVALEEDFVDIALKQAENENTIEEKKTPTNNTENPLENIENLIKKDTPSPENRKLEKIFPDGKKNVGVGKETSKKTDQYREPLL